ncbi:MAG: transcriptional repressor [Candidatus Moraniibacteriota bacterium]
MNECCNKKMSIANLRDTETRRVLLALLHNSAKPLAPPEIVSLCHKAGRSVNKTTIYRDLSAMEQAGIVQRVIVSDRKQYFELTERGHHHHLICTSCDQIQDIELEEESVLKRAKDIGKRLGFAISSHAVEFYGVCRTCSCK